jgi:hypothetical protein
MFSRSASASAPELHAAASMKLRPDLAFDATAFDSGLSIAHVSYRGSTDEFCNENRHICGLLLSVRYLGCTQALSDAGFEESFSHAASSPAFSSL